MNNKNNKNNNNNNNKNNNDNNNNNNNNKNNNYYYNCSSNNNNNNSTILATRTQNICYRKLKALMSSTIGVRIPETSGNIRNYPVNHPEIRSYSDES